MERKDRSIRVYDGAAETFPCPWGTSAAPPHELAPFRPVRTREDPRSALISAQILQGHVCSNLDILPQYSIRSTIQTVARRAREDVRPEQGTFDVRRIGPRSPRQNIRRPAKDRRRVSQAKDEGSKRVHNPRRSRRSRRCFGESKGW